MKNKTKTKVDQNAAILLRRKLGYRESEIIRDLGVDRVTVRRVERRHDAALQKNVFERPEKD